MSYRSAKTRCKILSSACGCSSLAVCVNLSRLFKNKLGLIFFRGLVFFPMDSETSFSRKSAKPRENGSPESNTDALHWDDFILFTSAKVVLDRRPHNTFSNTNAPCVLLSLMPTRPFLNGCLVGVCFLGFVHSSSSSSVSCSHLSPTASNSNQPCIGRWLTSVKFRCKIDVHWFNKLF